jgi:hypothetical protein
MLEMQDLARKEAIREGAVENVSFPPSFLREKLTSSH